MKSFNPCFNGTYSLTHISQLSYAPEYPCFNPCFNGTYSLTLLSEGDVTKVILF